MTTTDQDVPMVTPDAVRLGDCPPGLFRFNDTIGFKTEYRGMETIGPVQVPGSETRWVVGRHSEVYVVESGEAFWGGVRSKDAREDLIVTPISLASVSSASAEEAEHLQTIDERDAAEAALSDAYRAVCGKEPAWSNQFDYNDAINEIRETAASPEPVPATNQAGELELRACPFCGSANPVLIPQTGAVECVDCGAIGPGVEGDDGVKLWNDRAALATQPATSQEGSKSFASWSTETLAQQCRMQSRDQLDPEFSGFLAEVADRLAATPTPPTLSEDLREVVEALEPFAAACNITTAEDSESLHDSLAAEKLTWRDLRRARAVFLSQGGKA